MTEHKRNLLVALFVIAGLFGLGWLIFRFGDLPAALSRVDAHEITLYFPQAPGIQKNSAVLFRGFPIGLVIAVYPPAPLPDLDNPQHSCYQVPVVVAVSREYQVPDNVTPKVFRRGLGGSYLEFVLDDTLPPSEKMLADGDRLKGFVSEGSEFISETTQKKLDNLIASLISLSVTLQGQLDPLPPEIVDADPNHIRPNLTTAVMRLDQALKNANVVIGDLENQRNLKQGLAQFTALAAEMRQAVRDTQNFTAEALTLIKQTSQTIGNIDIVATEINDNFRQAGVKIQNAADQLAQTLKYLDDIFAQVAQGRGTVGRLLNDPQLYDSFNDASQNLTLALAEFRQLVKQWTEQGAKVKLQ